MRLTIKIENQDALANGQELIKILDRKGLQIGRAADVDWQLPDPAKLISSIHAEIRFRDGVYTLRDKSRNGTFLNGITRQRMIKLLREAGVTVQESTLRIPDFETADEIFMSGNYAKCMPVLKFQDRSLQPGPFYRKAREAYWEFARSQPV